MKNVMEWLAEFAAQYRDEPAPGCQAAVVAMEMLLERWKRRCIIPDWQAADEDLRRLCDILGAFRGAVSCVAELQREPETCRLRSG